MRYLLVLAFIALSSPAKAETGNSLLPLCTSKSEQQLAYCQGFVTGAWLATSTPVCVPNGATPRQLIDVSVRYIKDHPKDRGTLASELIARALHEAFPCK